MSGLGYFDQDDIVDRANFPEAPVRVTNTYEEVATTEPEKAEAQPGYILETVKLFIQDFHKAFRSKDQQAILILYEGAFNELSEKHFKSTSWPKIDEIAPLVDKDPLFLVLYKEMYYRHLYSINTGNNVTLEDRVESFQNYFNLFAYILRTPNERIDLDLPNQWIWDIVDEYIWQYNDYARYRTKLLARHQIRQLNKDKEKEKDKDDEPEKKNCEFVSQHREIWSTTNVIQTLNALVKKSEVVTLLDPERKGGGASEILEVTGGTHFVRMIGYYSLIGLLRVHTLTGDYYSAIRSVDCIDFTKKVQIFSKVVACHITLYYYTGFVFMMLRRYADAIRFFIQLLTYINRIKNIHARSYQFDDLVKKHEQVYHLLAMTLALCDQRHGVDEAINATMRERLGDKISRLAQGDIDCYSEMFKYACPKFVSISSNFGENASTGVMEAVDLQRTVFLNEVSQQLVLPTIRSYLSLYSTITVGKLASFMEQDNKVPENLFRTYLLRLKHKTRQLVWTGGKPSEGDRISTSDIGFYINKDMVYVQSYANSGTLQNRSHAQYFIDQIRYLRPFLDTLFNTNTNVRR